MNFYLCLVRTRKKLEKHIKKNKIKKAVIIHIPKLMEAEGLDPEKLMDLNERAFFNLLVASLIKKANERGKDVYYMPNFYNKHLSAEALLKLKEIENIKSFNLIVSNSDFEFVYYKPFLVDMLSYQDEFDRVLQIG